MGWTRDLLITGQMHIQLSQKAGYMLQINNDNWHFPFHFFDDDFMFMSLSTLFRPRQAKKTFEHA